MAKHFMLMGLFLLTLKGFAQSWVDVPINGAVYQQDQNGQAYIDVLGSYPVAWLRNWQVTAYLDKLDLNGNLITSSPRVTIPITGDGVAFFNGRVQTAKGWYRLTVRATGFFATVGNKTTTSQQAIPINPPNPNSKTYTSVSKVGIGEVFIVAGQSNAQGLPASDVTPLPVPAIDAVRVQPNKISDINFLDPAQAVSFQGNRFPFVSPMRAVSDNASEIAP